MFKLVVPRSWDPVLLHDWFNLVVIAVLNAQNLTYLATGAGFQLFFTSAMVYFLLDTIFVGVYPQSVKSPVVILSHHICTALYMLIPYHYPRYEWCMSYCMLVEINTWLLIARRTLGGRALEAAFYASWVLLRNVFYPYLIWAFYKEWAAETAACGSPWNWILVTPVCQAFLTGLNYHWTLQLVVKVLRAPRNANGGGKYGKHLRGGTSALAAVADVRSGAGSSGSSSSSGGSSNAGDDGGGSGSASSSDAAPRRAGRATRRR
ncbi:hypothetical protein HT031_000068 [Scenedesmus sp. PABB004]|nr:hypothetical protein HT031_000068 [Scenedesmus sp. PABB004]